MSYTDNIPEQLLSGISEVARDAERRGYQRGYADARKFDGVIDPKREVFIVPAHSGLGNWRVESCAWSANGPDFYVESSPGQIAVFQTLEEAEAAAGEQGYIVSSLEPHAPGMMRQNIRPPYAW